MKTRYLLKLIEKCDCLNGYTVGQLKYELEKYSLDELTGNLWEDVPYINKELPFAISCAEEDNE